MSAISASLTLIRKPPRRSFKKSEFISVIKSDQNCFWFAKALPAASTLLSVKLTKLILDIVCSSADLVLKNIIVPILPVTQSVNLPVSVSPWKFLLRPDFIRCNIFSIALRYGLPYAASSLFKFASLNISSALDCHCSKALARLVVLRPSSISVVTVPAGQPSLGPAY